MCVSLLQAFCFELLHPLIRIDPTLRLTKDYVFDELGPAAFDKTSDFKLSEWLASQEDNHRIGKELSIKDIQYLGGIFYLPTQPYLIFTNWNNHFSIKIPIFEDLHPLQYLYLLFQNFPTRCQSLGSQ